MDEATALRTAARRYCQERFSEWAGIYEKLNNNLPLNWALRMRFSAARYSFLS
jgi:hypothetical protein